MLLTSFRFCVIDSPQNANSLLLYITTKVLHEETQLRNKTNGRGPIHPMYKQTIGKRETRFIKQKPMFLCHKLGGLASPKQARDMFLMFSGIIPLAQPSVICFLLPLKATSYR